MIKKGTNKFRTIAGDADVMWLIGLVMFFAWLTHVFNCFDGNRWGFLLAGALFFLSGYSMESGYGLRDKNQNLKPRSQTLKFNIKIIPAVAIFIPVVNASPAEGNYVWFF